MAQNRDEESVSKGYGAGWQIVSAGFQLVFSILFFAWMGYLLDRKAHTQPLFLLIGLGLGLAAGFYAFWLKVKAEAKPDA